MFVAWRDIRFARGRFALIVAVVTLITILVGFLSGLTGGLAWQNISGVVSLPADRVVLAPSSTGATPSLADSAVTTAQKTEWANSPGIDSVTGLGISQLRAQTSDERIAVAVYGEDDVAGVSKGDVLLSTPAASELNAAVGDTVTIAGLDFTVSAVAGDDWYSHTPIVRLTLGDWQALQAATGNNDAFATALLVKGEASWSTVDAEAGTTSASVVGALATLPAFRSEIGSLLLIVALLFGISSLVVGAFFTVWTMQRRGDVAILKALGASTSALRRDALGQALVVLTGGTAVGMLVVTGAGLAIQGSLPFLLSPLTTVVPALLMIVVGLVGAAFALRSVTTADPLTALGSNR
ncbi:putative ABC transport system permease protein [Microbacterium halimionae]|uniref:Putative ABC transport system permease protein n=1 Tax=Microbacterium halimionae TaxID=1526413 RepID=A0A7W3PLF8_9MICO|nr:ABC transporter permease [Microbacterium halimionae]MBA8815966.1 putative ABC transport system permease protein [Microbacterium halimionae]NII96169.1 putative ABC transport system permease protein [Microbacterium halimionae]